ncbi:Tryptophan 2,3-dioxygenase [Labeo rohita]|uniref:Tryptophan 2,3-dioxygenase n=1 Tax=Labeo rohita TaxID=84645 RepID=A0ABQ8MMU6_LABRO|nr:Tryptophan 2,3-dioxygenase [Labeo rohita]
MSNAASQEGLMPDEAEDSAEQLPSAALLSRRLMPNLQPCPAPVPLFPEVHEELSKMWKAPYSACTHLGSSLLTTLDDGAARGRNRPRLPSKACKLPTALAAKAYSAAGQAASALQWPSCRSTRPRR